jgi:hypothetical protein
MKKQFLLLMLLALCGLQYHVAAQKGSILPQEKVFLHLDKPYYVAGDTLWFKAYLQDAATHKIDSASRVLYVDLLNLETNKLIRHLSIPVLGTGTGAITLSDTLTQGNYALRAYTNYMRNFSEEFFFHQKIKIWAFKPTEDNTEGISPTAIDIAEVNFFPEGGDLVTNLESRVAFKAINKLGKGVETTGFILDNKGDSTVFFNTSHLGMGIFQFKPEANKTYTAYLKKLDGTWIKRTMPKALYAGYTLAISSLANKDKVKVFISSQNAVGSDTSGTLLLVASQRSKICFIGKIPKKNANQGVNIAKSVFEDDGVVTITLLTEKAEPLCERLIFIKQKKQLKLTIQTDKAVYKPREKVTLSVEALDSGGKPVQGEFSLSVTDASQVLHEAYSQNLLSYMLLTSDVSPRENNYTEPSIRGFIEQPSAYFNEADPEANLKLDILMMTQGWRRYLWQDANTKPKVNFFVEDGLYVSGVAKRPNGKVSPNTTITMMFQDSRTKKSSLRFEGADSLGRFAFYNLNIIDTTALFLQATKEKGGKNLILRLDKDSIPAIVPSKNIMPIDLSDANAKEFAGFLRKSRAALELEKKSIFNKSKLLQEVTVKATVQRDTRTNYKTPSKRFSIDEEHLCDGAISVMSMLVGRVAGVNIQGAPGQETVVFRGQNITPAFFIDGMAVTQDMLETINPCDIEFLDVLKDGEAFTTGSALGISILTKRGNPNYDWSKDTNQDSPNVVMLKKVGYARAKEFYAPTYLPSSIFEKPDFRSTLFWQPVVKTDANGKASISFYNSDATNKINVNMQGIAPTGKIGVNILEYSVKK